MSVEHMGNLFETEGEALKYSVDQYLFGMEYEQSLEEILDKGLSIWDLTNELKESDWTLPIDNVDDKRLATVIYECIMDAKDDLNM